MFNRIFKAAWFATKAAVIIGMIALLIAFMGSPVFFGIVLVTASTMATVYLYTAITFAVGFIWNLLSKKTIS